MDLSQLDKIAATLPQFAQLKICSRRLAFGVNHRTWRRLKKGPVKTQETLRKIAQNLGQFGQEPVLSMAVGEEFVNTTHPKDFTLCPPGFMAVKVEEYQRLLKNSSSKARQRKSSHKSANCKRSSSNRFSKRTGSRIGRRSKFYVGRPKKRILSATSRKSSTTAARGERSLGMKGRKKQSRRKA